MEGRLSPERPEKIDRRTPFDYFPSVGSLQDITCCYSNVESLQDTGDLHSKVENLLTIADAYFNVESWQDIADFYFNADMIIRSISQVVPRSV